MRKRIKMSNGLIFRLRKDEYAEGAQKSLDNAKEFVAIARFCQTRHFFAKGAANMIFAMEELAKAAYLQLKALNPHINIANLDSYFHKHEVKHKGFTAILYVLNISQEGSITSLEKPVDDSKKAAGLVVILFIILAVWLIADQQENKQKTNVSNRAKEGQEFHELIRQMGLYVEFDEDERIWLSPNEAIDESLFQILFEHVESAFNTIEEHLFGDQATAEWAIEVAEALDDEHIRTRDARKQLKKT